MNTTEKLACLRDQMSKKGFDAYIIPSSDSHQSEYVAEFFKARQWISGFTGSAGTVVVTLEDAGLWTDGRYYLQAAKQLQDTGIKLFKAADPEVPSYPEWLSRTLPTGTVIGINGDVIDVKSARELEDKLSQCGIRTDFNVDLIAAIWSDRPTLPDAQIFEHEVKFAGTSRVDKLIEVRAEMKRLDVSAFVLSSLDDIAWLLNFRGADVVNNPVAICHALITLDTCHLFIDQNKVSKELKKAFATDGVLVEAYSDIAMRLSERKPEDRLLFEPSKTSISLIRATNQSVKKIEALNITTRMKAIKNETEIMNLKECMIHDGVALVKLIKWLKSTVGKEKIDEVDVDVQLLSYRKEQPHFVSPSFDSIIGYQENAAMMHYKALPETARCLEPKGFLLIDSGGQYHTGTTDTTRTVVLGPLTQEEKTDFTLVLKGHIGLSSAKFLKGVSGHYLDVLARQPLWQQGIDYKCGTGHGIGFFLNVHEGPQRFAMVPNDIKLERNMVITNEPGVYKEGKHGIRTENVLVVKEGVKNESGQFMEFEEITICPIDLDGVLPELLSIDERNWLNRYHKKVSLALAPYLNEEENAWLMHETREI